MNFGQIQTMVLTDGFDETKRADCKHWINAAYQRIWDLEQWGFKTAKAACTSAAGTRELQGVPADLGTLLDLFDSDENHLRLYQEPRAFYRLYSDTRQGRPAAALVMGASTIELGPVPDAARDYTLIYEKGLTLLVDDSDVPAIPAGYHMALVHAPRAHGFRILGIPLAASEEEAETNLLLAMRMSHLSNVRGETEQMRPYRPC